MRVWFQTDGDRQVRRFPTDRCEASRDQEMSSRQMDSVYVVQFQTDGDKQVRQFPTDRCEASRDQEMSSRQMDGPDRG